MQRGLAAPACVLALAWPGPAAAAAGMAGGSAGLTWTAAALVLMSGIAGLILLGRRAPSGRLGAGLLPREGAGWGARLVRRAMALLQTRRGSGAVVGGALCLGLLLRLLTLGSRPLWVDEAGSWGYGLLDADTLINVMGRLELTPPGYYLAVGAWMQLGGDGVFWLRLPSALLGAAAILPFSLFLRRAFGTAAAAWGAVLLALAGAAVHYAQEARVYSALLFLFVLGLMLAERLVATTGARRWWLAAGLALVTGVMIHLHFTSIFAAATFHVYALALLAQRRSPVAAWLPVFASGLGGLLLAAPVLWLALAIAGNTTGAAYWMPVPGPQEAWLEFRNALLAPQLERIALPGALLSLLALGSCLWVGRRNPQIRALSVAFVFAVAAVWGISQVTPILMDRTILFTLALYLAVLAGGLASFRRPLLVALVVVAALAPQAKGTLNHLRSTTFYGEAWDSLAAQLDREARPGEAIMAIGAFEAVALDYQFRNGGTLRTTVAVGDAEQGVNTVAIRLMTDAVALPGSLLGRKTLCQAVGGAPAIWLVSREIAAYPEFYAGVERVLRETGSLPLSLDTHGTLMLQRWSAPTRCD
ncbi:glycosyltransferase family 39 protein [Siccirubricoccus sp. G192]|uniref:glycosyltransferase family 39 protein n=1 Tax=Siccirubricoccus sp. G192 TaxID=2849651 RepID=UPI001C2C4B9F|nr:glycosyltransferase family 39 protein [Siccirubricoccus sp. G192]MBV1799242.1 glycosyltransferase family 39 protein [Siccirubricoccus sp. G192]